MRRGGKGRDYSLSLASFGWRNVAWRLKHWEFAIWNTPNFKFSNCEERAKARNNGSIRSCWSRSMHSHLCAFDGGKNGIELQYSVYESWFLVMCVFLWVTFNHTSEIGSLYSLLWPSLSPPTSQSSGDMNCVFFRISRAWVNFSRHFNGTYSQFTYKWMYRAFWPQTSQRRVWLLNRVLK